MVFFSLSNMLGTPLRLSLRLQLVWIPTGMTALMLSLLLFILKVQRRRAWSCFNTMELNL